MTAREAGQPDLRRSALKVFAAAAALGTLGPVAGLAYQEGVTPPAFSALRAAIGAGILGALVLTRRQRPGRRHGRWDARRPQVHTRKEQG